MNSVMPKCKTSLDTSRQNNERILCLIKSGRPFQVQRNKTVANSEGTQIHLQRQLILCSLQYASLRLKEQNPQKRLCFSKFAYLWTKSNVLAGVSSVHAVCMCETDCSWETVWQLIMTFIQNCTWCTTHKMLAWRLWSANKKLTYQKYWIHIGKHPKTVQPTQSGWLPTDQCCKQLHNVVATVSSLVLLLHQPTALKRDTERDNLILWIFWKVLFPCTTFSREGFHWSNIP
jgi:hypothetical protein